MRPILKLVDPTKEFLLGIDLTQGMAESIDTGEQREVNILSFGFFLIEVNIIWYIQN